MYGNLYNSYKWRVAHIKMRKTQYKRESEAFKEVEHWLTNNKSVSHTRSVRDTSCPDELRERKWGIARSILRAHVLSQSGSVALLTVNNTSDTNDSSVDGAWNAVRELHVDLWHLEVRLVVCVVFLDISLWGGIDHVALLETLDGLILGDTTTAVSASDCVSVALVLLVPTVVSSLWRHIYN